jgi:hypothetical protein
MVVTIVELSYMSFPIPEPATLLTNDTFVKYLSPLIIEVVYIAPPFPVLLVVEQAEKTQFVILNVVKFPKQIPPKKIN